MASMRAVLPELFSPTIRLRPGLKASSRSSKILKSLMCTCEMCIGCQEVQSLTMPSISRPYLVSTREGAKDMDPKNLTCGQFHSAASSPARKTFQEILQPADR